MHLDWAEFRCESPWARLLCVGGSRRRSTLRGEVRPGVAVAAALAISMTSRIGYA